MRQAAEAADVSLGTVTYHFSNREQLVSFAFAALADHLESIVTTALSRSHDQRRDAAHAILVSALHHL